MLYSMFPAGLLLWLCYQITLSKGISVHVVHTCSKTISVPRRCGYPSPILSCHPDLLPPVHLSGGVPGPAVSDRPHRPLALPGCQLLCVARVHEKHRYGSTGSVPPSGGTCAVCRLQRKYRIFPSICKHPWALVHVILMSLETSLTSKRLKTSQASQYRQVYTVDSWVQVTIHVLGLPTGGLMHSSWTCESTGSWSSLVGHRLLQL